MNDLLTCFNCSYEIDEASKQGFCDSCERAYQLGISKGESA